MRARANHKSLRCARRGSVLVIVLWIAFGLVSLALYFANSMNFELRASDNRVCAQAADQAIEPVVVGLGRLGPPLVDRPALARGDDVGFRVGDVLGKEPVLLGLLAEQRQRALERNERRLERRA
jgi:hypothetical protein